MTDRRNRARKIKIVVSGSLMAIALIVSLVILKPAMPNRIRLLTGPRGSAYHDLGLRYAAELADRGLAVEVILTAGGLDNLRQLASGDDDTVGFAPSTLDPDIDAGLDLSRLETLGNVDYEPLWLFFRPDLDIQRIPDLTRHVVGTGGRGTVADHVARTMIAYTGITDDVEIRTIDISSGESVLEAIQAAQIDALFVTGLPESTLVGALLGSEAVSFLSFERAPAYAARIRGVDTVVVPEGALDLARNVPPERSRLLTAFTGLVALDGLHPSVVPLMLNVASDLRDQETFVPTEVVFPNSENRSLALAPSAKRYFEQGERGLSKLLPYKVSRFLNHLGFVVLPLLTLVVLLLKVVPLGLRIYGSARLTGLLKQLEAVEKADAAGAARSKLLTDLDRIDASSATVFIPRSKVHDYIDFRQFLHDMRERVERKDADA